MATTRIEILTPFQKYDPPGRCIYCGNTNCSLTKEHIIPFGLGDDSLVFQKASCDDCRKKTMLFETACLRHMWWPLRTRLGAPSAGKEKPTTFKLRRMRVTAVNQDGSIQYDPLGTTDVPPLEYPRFYVAFKFGPPGILSLRTPTVNEAEDFCLMSASDADRYVTRNREGFRLAPGHMLQFTQLLAKIAYGYACAELGLNAF